MTNEYTFHKDVWFPGPVLREAIPHNLPLTYSAHALARTQQKGLWLPSMMPVRHQVIEVTYRSAMEGTQLVKWLARCPLRFGKQVLVLVVQPDGFVRTAWYNMRGDTHQTLDVTRYQQKGQPTAGPDTASSQSIPPQHSPDSPRTPDV